MRLKDALKGVKILENSDLWFADRNGSSQLMSTMIELCIVKIWCRNTNVTGYGVCGRWCPLEVFFYLVWCSGYIRFPLELSRRNIISLSTNLACPWCQNLIETADHILISYLVGLENNMELMQF